ncbi:hypothetical protein DH2020_011267 [Rehmannia glutinosa]|uniref:Reverse transcriptase domain-containing protein n=1 Tax=Rehmannia glutinosa TaxID=99300 RepID=A0ABR0XCZ6_REHGL
MLHVHISKRDPHSLHKRRRKIFRFEALWVKSKDCEQIIRDNWNSDFDNLTEKLTNCTLGLLQWGDKSHGNLSSRISHFKKSLFQLQSGTITDTTRNLITDVKNQLDFLLEQDNIKWKQRAKQHWYVEGDRNTRFFHNYASKRKAINHIDSLLDSSGSPQSSPEALQQIITDYFGTLFSSANPPESNIEQALQRVAPKVTPKMNQALIAPYTEKEIILALKYMHPFKSPGPDGMSLVFFKKFWHIVGPNVLSFILNFLNNGIFDNKTNFTHIVLIPKINKPVLVSQFCPISLCNVVYKLASKAIAIRLQDTLPRVISESQSTFILGRLITDNILVAYEIHHHMRTKPPSRIGLISIKLDMSKVFDRVEWIFLHKNLVALGYAHQFDLQRVNKIRGISISRTAPNISHLFFADDTLLLGQAMIEEARHIRYAINLYERVSGQQINHEKSGIVFCRNVPHELANSISTILGINQVAGHNKYLGLPSISGRNKKELCSNIKDRIWQHIQSWDHHSLSKSGEEILIKSVLQAMPIYVMSCFRFPDTFIAELHSLIGTYWWDRKLGKKKIHWVSWKTLSTVKSAGGLGFKDLRIFNLAMLDKQA